MDSPYVVGILARRKGERQPKDKLLDSAAARFRKLWYEVAKVLEHAVGPPHSVRHSGPAHDVGGGYRTLWQAQRRGRWASEKSVQRYAKTHTWVEQRSRVKPATMEEGRHIWESRAQRPTIARE